MNIMPKIMYNKNYCGEQWPTGIAIIICNYSTNLPAGTLKHFNMCSHLLIVFVYPVYGFVCNQLTCL